MRKRWSWFFTSALLAAMLSGCGGAPSGSSATPTSEPETPSVQETSPSEPAGEPSAEIPGGVPNVPAGEPTVFMTTDISTGGLMAVYEALEAEPAGNVAVKLSTGEPGSNYLRTELIGELVQSLDAAIVECNTAYGGIPDHPQAGQYMEQSPLRQVWAALH